jgi:hypothetical protein
MAGIRLESRLKPFVRILALSVALGALAAPAVQAQPDPQQQNALHSALHLRPDQEPAFHAFASISPGPDEQQRIQGANPQQLAGLRAPDRIDRVLAAQTAVVGILRRQAAATRALYGVLSPDQQHTFDQFTAPRQNGGQGQGGQGQRPSY